MMEDLISRQESIDRIDTIAPGKTDSDYQKGIAVGMAMAKVAIIEQKSAEPDRKTGKWQITDAYPHNVYCSLCYKKFAQAHWDVWEDGSLPRNYCPNCGAKMEEDV